MARHIHNAGLDSRSARLKFKDDNIHRQSLGGKLSIGWARGKNGAGRWIARRYLGDEKYTTETIGEADDLADANGDTVLNFDQAQIKARKWSSDLEEKERIAALGPAVTVRIAAHEYLNERSTSRDVRSKMNHLLADKALAEKPLAALTVDALKQWRASLLDKKWRAGLIERKMTEASARRIVNDVRACLNAAAERHGHKLPPAIREVIRNGLAVPKGSDVDNAREKQILTDADIKRVIDAAEKIDGEKGWGSDLYLMVLVLAATGARFSQVARLRVADLDVEHGRLMMPPSRKGSRKKEKSEVAVPILDDVLDRLKRAVAGRRGHEPLLLRPHWRRAPGGKFGVLEIYARKRWGEAHTLKEPWAAIVERAGLKKGTVAYSLRHSSITRSLRKGLPTQLVAKIHDTSVGMLERYYSRFISDALDDLARAALIPLVTAPVAPLRVVER
jgi:integrase